MPGAFSVITLSFARALTGLPGGELREDSFNEAKGAQELTQLFPVEMDVDATRARVHSPALADGRRIGVRHH